MAKPEIYKGDDAVKLRCVQAYAVKDTRKDKAGKPDPVTYEKGKTYPVSPRSAVHLLRKMYAVRKEVNGKMQYAGDAPCFVDEAAAKAAEDDEKKLAAAEAAAKKAAPKE